jgi:hypothetical protein
MTLAMGHQSQPGALLKISNIHMGCSTPNTHWTILLFLTGEDDYSQDRFLAIQWLPTIIIRGVATLRVKQNEESRFSMWNDTPDFLHIIHTFLTLRYKWCREQRLSALNNSGKSIQNCDYPLEINTNLKSLQILSKRLRKSPFLKKSETKNLVGLSL